MIITRYKRPIQTYPYLKGFDLFNEFLNTFEQSQKQLPVSDFYPNVNTREAKDAYHVEIDLPGIKKKDIDINIEDNILTISGERELKDEVEDKNYYKIESAYGSFSRSFTLPEKIDSNKIEAKSTDGVLEVIIPKSKVIENKVKKIEIK
jgi:HSP20 family protein